MEAYFHPEDKHALSIIFGQVQELSLIETAVVVPKWDNHYTTIPKAEILAVDPYTDSDIAISKPVLLHEVPTMEWPEDRSQYALIITPYHEGRQGLEGFQRMDLSHINNPNGTIRWIYPEGKGRPLFPYLYNASTWQGRLYRRLMKGRMSGRIAKWQRSGRFSIFYRPEYAKMHPILAHMQKNFALYTGIPGRNRKAVLVFKKENKSVFLKVPMSCFSKAQLENEHRQLYTLSAYNFTSMKIPQSNYDQKWGSVLLEDIRPEKVIQQLGFCTLHARVIAEMVQLSLEKKAMGETSYYRELENSLHKLEEKEWKDNGLDKSAIRHIEGHLRMLFAALPIEQEITLSYSHGDFTPWNMYLSDDRAYLYDWEQSRESAPLLYDMFHFVLHVSVLVKRIPHSEIQGAVDDASGKEEIKALIGEHQVDVSLHLRLYLLHIISQYLLKYADQDFVEEQGHWMLETFKGLLEDTMHTTGAIEATLISPIPMRSGFIEDLFHKLKGFDYSILKHLETAPFQVDKSSDIDMLMDREQMAEVISFVRSHPFTAKVKEVQKSQMTFLYLYFYDQGFLEIDLIHAFHRKSLRFLSAAEVLEGSIVSAEGVRLPHLQHQWEYIYLFYVLNRALVSEKYVQGLLSMPLEQVEKIVAYTSQKYGVNFRSSDEMLYPSKEQRTRIVKTIKANGNNRLSQRWGRSIAYIQDSWKSLLWEKGIIITFSGVDGAGKSTIIENFKETLANKYRLKIKVLRHRPSVLPILSAVVHGKEKAEQRQAALLPHEGNNKGRLSSLLRFFYYYIDYLLGQFYIKLKYTLRGYTVIYDRYYFDFIVDSKRSNIHLGGAWLRRLYRWVLSPDINFFLYADAATIYKRKQELEPEVIQSLTQKYLVLFRKLQLDSKVKNRYVPIDNEDLQTTLALIEEHYREKV